MTRTAQQTTRFPDGPIVTVLWQEVRPGLWQSRAVDPRNGRVYISYPVPTVLAHRLSRGAIAYPDKRTV